MDKRLSYQNLKSDKDLNTLESNVQDKIWKPISIFTNTKKNIKTNTIKESDNEPSISILRKGAKVLKNEATRLDLSYLFNGENNPIVMETDYAIDFICDFKLAWYPFDEQKCHIYLDLSEKDAKYVDLIPQNITYSGPIDSSQYQIKGFDIGIGRNYKGEIEKKGVIVTVTLGRKLLNTIMTTYIPTVLLVIISYATSFYHRDLFETVIAVNLTCMLVLATMFLSVIDSLPTTSYVKMVEVWLIYTLLIPFKEVLIISFIHHKTSATVSPTEDKIKTSKPNSLMVALFIRTYFIPLSFAAFTIVYWTIGVFVSY